MLTQLVSFHCSIPHLVSHHNVYSWVFLAMLKWIIGFNTETDDKWISHITSGSLCLVFGYRFLGNISHTFLNSFRMFYIYLKTFIVKCFVSIFIYSVWDFRCASWVRTGEAWWFKIDCWKQAKNFENFKWFGQFMNNRVKREFSISE